MEIRDHQHGKCPELPHPALALGYREEPQFDRMVERIENAMHVVAEVIANHGAEYLPIFERLERELEEHRARENALERALNLSREKRD